MNEMTNCLSSKMPSSLARTPPNTASSAATTAIGRYGCTHAGTLGSSQSPTSTPITSATMPTNGSAPLPRELRFRRGAGRQGQRRHRLDGEPGAVHLGEGGEPAVGVGLHQPGVQ